MASLWTYDMAECETCAYIVKKKKRRCRLQPVKGSIYCAEHLNIDESVCNDLHRSSHLHLEVYVTGTWPLINFKISADCQQFVHNISNLVLLKF